MLPDGTNYLYFSYDATGVIGFEYNSTQYYYLKNAQGDVIGIADSLGNVVTEYSYDAWGKQLSVAGTLASTVGEVNPIRYRGYYYDTETGLYYVSSRYYDPEVGRFINADEIDYLGADGELLSFNLFAYCQNNPVNRTDEGGNWSIPNWVKIAVTATIVVAAAVVITTVTAGTGTAACIALGAAHGAINGAAVGAVTGAVSGAVGGAIKSRIQNGSWEGAGKAAINGAVQGAIDGAFSGAITGAVQGAITSPYCFVAGTLILSEDGNVPIESICVGDKVYATDPEIGETALKEVVQLFRNETNEWIHLTVNDEEIVCTPGHPFYSPEKGWTAACDLRAGDILVTVNGECVVLEKIQHELLEEPETTYNFEVEGFHTYYVGPNYVLVHNACKFSADQQAVLDLAKENKNGLSMKDAETLWDWAQKYGISGHGPMSGHGKMWQGWHIKIKNYHIPIFPN